MIATGVFDDVDLMLSCHAMGIDMTKYHAEIGSSLNGFHHETRDLYWKGVACRRKSGRWCKCIKCSQSRNDRNQLPARDIPR